MSDEPAENPSLPSAGANPWLSGAEPWLLILLGVTHLGGLVAAVAVTGGRSAAIAAVVDLVALAGIGAGFLARLRRPSLSADSLLLGVLLLAVVASVVRAVAVQAPWLAADLALAAVLGTLLLRREVFAGGQLAVLLGGAVALVADVTSRPSMDVEPRQRLGWVAFAAGVALTCAAMVAVRQGWLSAVRELTRADRRLADLAITDPLTGTCNRRGLDLVANPMLEYARRQGEALHCLFLDLDGFRSLNEQLGRRRADEILLAVAEALKSSVRATDVVARWTGDEFVVIGPGTGTSPLEMERRVRTQLTDMPPVPAEAWTGKVSIGSATLVPWDEGDLDSLLVRAEQDMRLRRSLRRQASDRRAMAAPPPPHRSVPVDA